MAKKSLESSIAGRILELVQSNQAHHDAFEHHLAILGRARIDEDHDEIENAVSAGEREFGEKFAKEIAEVRAHISRERTRVAAEQSGKAE